MLSLINSYIPVTRWTLELHDAAADVSGLFTPAAGQRSTLSATTPVMHNIIKTH